MEYDLCELCPRKCRVNRNRDLGFCNAGRELKIAKAFVHLWEEPCISGELGSGTIFFSNCNLDCVFCQNYNISHEGYGKVVSIERLVQIMLELQEKKSNNINLVTPSLYIPLIKESIQMARAKGLKIPIIYNSSGYEEVSALKELEGLIDIYLPDIKYYDDKYSLKYSKAPNYFKFATKAIFEMLRQVGTPVFKNGILKKGVMIRHLMLPGLLFDSKKIIDWVASELPKEVYFNIMCQYTPMGDAYRFPEINKRINEKHYEALLDYAVLQGIENGFFQEFDSASSEYIPDFNLDGV
jgi:putative pyruvate formate lyase activating enzyme